MWTILLTVVFHTSIDVHHSSTMLLGDYKDAKTCEDIANQLRGASYLAQYLKKTTSARCVQIKD